MKTKAKTIYDEGAIWASYIPIQLEDSLKRELRLEKCKKLRKLIKERNKNKA